jgi:hypothetical protein
MHEGGVCRCCVTESVDTLSVERRTHLFVEPEDVGQKPVVGDIVFGIERGMFSSGDGMDDMFQVPEQQLVILMVYIGKLEGVLLHQLLFGSKMKTCVFDQVKNQLTQSLPVDLRRHAGMQFVDVLEQRLVLRVNLRNVDTVFLGPD